LANGRSRAFQMLAMPTASLWERRFESGAAYARPTTCFAKQALRDIGQADGEKVPRNSALAQPRLEATNQGIRQVSHQRALAGLHHHGGLHAWQQAQVAQPPYLLR